VLEPHVPAPLKRLAALWPARLGKNQADIADANPATAALAAAHREHGPVPLALPAVASPVRVPQGVGMTAVGPVTADPDPLAGS